MFRPTLSARLFLNPELKLGTKFRSLGFNSVEKLTSCRNCDEKSLKTAWTLLIKKVHGELRLDELDFFPNSARACMSAFKFSKSPRIALYGCKFYEEHIDNHLPLLFRSLSSHTRHLSIQKCRLDDRSADIIAQLVNEVSLDTLDLSSNNIGFRGAELLGDTITKNSPIEKVILGDNFLSVDDALQIETNPKILVPVTNRWAN